MVSLLINGCLTFPLLTSGFRAGGWAAGRAGYPRTPEASLRALSLLCPSLDSPGPVRTQNTRSGQQLRALHFRRAQALYRLHTYMAKIETHGITCICKSANQTRAENSYLLRAACILAQKPPTLISCSFKFFRVPDPRSQGCLASHGHWSAPFPQWLVKEYCLALQVEF